MILKSLSAVLRDPTAETTGNGTPPPESPQSPAPDSGGLTPDQQKVASALNKIAAAQSSDTAPVKQPRVHKSIFTPPPSTVLEKEFSVGEDQSVLDEGTPTVKTEDTTRSNIHGDDKKKEEQVVTPPVKSTPPVVKQTTDIKIKVGDAKPFDYSGFAPEESAVLRQMSSQARDFTAKILGEVKQLRDKKPDVYYQHQDAYTLDPAYKELGTTLEYTGKEIQHWKEQLLRIRKGETWMNLEGYDDKGNPILKGPFKPTDDLDITLTAGYQQLISRQAELQQQQVGYGAQYQQQVKRDNAVLEAEQASRFDWVKDPAKLEEKVDIGGKYGPTPIKQIRSEFKQLFAGYHQSSPMLDLASNMFVALQIYGARIRELEGTNQHKDRLKQDILDSEPNLETAKGGGKGEGAEFSIEGLPE